MIAIGSLAGVMNVFLSVGSLYLMASGFKLL